MSLTTITLPNAEPPNAEPPNAESSDSVSSDSESSDSESEDEEADIAPEATVGTVTQRRRLTTEASCVQTKLRLALLNVKELSEKREKLLDHDLGDVERTLGNVLEMLKVLESGENATLKKRLTETETKLAWARMERDIAEGRLHESRVEQEVNNGMDGAHRRAVAQRVPTIPMMKVLSIRRKKSIKKSSFDGAKGPSEPRGPPSDSY
ncbi:hypothetical protein Tco_0505671 [Tanacetum coccineum]